MKREFLFIILCLNFNNVFCQSPLFQRITWEQYIQVDSNKQRISDYVFNDVDYTAGELTAVKIDDNWGYVNYKGEFTIPLKYKLANHFSNGKAYVSDGIQFYFINEMDEIITEKFDTIYGHSDFYYYRKDNQYGFLDSLAEIIEEPIFEKVDGFYEEKISVKYNGEWMSWSYNGLDCDDNNLYFYQPELIPIYKEDCKEDDKKKNWGESCSKKQMLVDLYKNINYPAEARNNNIDGDVILQFIVNENGFIQNPKILRGIGEICDNEVLRATKFINKWYKSASTLNGNPVKMIITLPIRFRVE